MVDTNTLSYCHTHMAMCGWYKKYIFILVFGINTRITKHTLFFSFKWICDEDSKSKPLGSVNQTTGSVYDNLACDEDSQLHCLEPRQHRWVLDPNYIKAQVVMVRKATRPPTWSHPVCLQNHHLAFWEPAPLHPKKWPFCALWAYILGFVNRMATIGMDKPP